MKKHIFPILVVFLCLNVSAYENANQHLTPPRVEKSFRQFTSLQLEFESFKLSADSGALLHDLDLQFSILDTVHTQPMPGNLQNSTGNMIGCYRLLPNGEHFSVPARITIPYDVNRIPKGYSAQDVYSFSYDDDTQLWTQLERISVDTIHHTITSYTTHFTDFANAVIKVPEMPESKAFVPTAMTDLPDINPLLGIPMIAAPQANNRGTAELSYPIDLPKGRRGLQPNVDLHYSSAGGNGILGIGWSMSIPAITIDTRWGVPRYSTNDETEAYLLNGEQLLMQDEKGNPLELANKSTQFEQRKRGDIRFQTRDRRNQDYIIRSGNGPIDYYWIVTDRSGTTYYYGYDPLARQIDYNSVLTDASGNIAEWSLVAVVDVYGNYVRYHYSKDYSSPNGKNMEKYIDSIQYTGNINTQLPPVYSVCFKYSDSRNDTIFDGRLGFLRQTARILCTIQVMCHGDAIASYVMDYDCSARTLSKMRLRAITKYDAYLAECAHTEMRTSAWTVYDELTLANEELNQVEDSLLERDVIADRAQIPGSRTTFNYCDAVELSKIYRGNSKRYSLDNLGSSFNHSFGGGAPLAVGVGGNIMKTDKSVGFKFDISYGLGKTNAMMIDLNGDGLPDYVYDDDQQINYRRQNPDGSFDNYRVVGGIQDLVREHDLSYGLGFQASFGAQLSASPSEFTNSFTDIYFADVNNDHLPDLITSAGVMINRLDRNGNPSFERLIGDSIKVDDKHCNIVVRNGEVDPRLECALSYEFVEFIPWEKLYAGGYAENEDKKRFEEEKNQEDAESQIAEIPVQKLLNEYQYVEDESIVESPRDTQHDDIRISSPIPMADEWTYSDYRAEKTMRFPTLEDVLSQFKAPDYKIVSTPDGLTIYRLQSVCSNKDSLPQVDVVRVWVADKQRTILLNSKIRLLNDSSEDRSQSRKFDGVKYAIQRCKSVQVDSRGRLSSTHNELIREGYIETKNDTIWHSHTQTLSVSEGDILMFRLSARDNRFFDDTEWIQEITDTRTHESFKSYDDFYCWSNGDFHAISSGSVDVNVDIDNLQSRDITVSVYKNGGMIAEDHVVNGSGNISVSTSVNAGDSISVRVGYNTEPQWSKVLVNPTIIYHADDLPEPVEYKVGSTIVGGVSHIRFQNDRRGTRYKSYKALFGELHKNWGQFAYHNVANDDLILPQSLSNYVDDMSAKLSNQQDTSRLSSQLRNYKDKIEADKDNVYNGQFQQGEDSVSMPDFMDEYNPYSSSRRWISMQADAAAHKWIVIGNLGALGARLQSTSLQPIAGADTTSVEIEYYDSSIPVSLDGSKVKTIRKQTFSYHPNASVEQSGDNAHISGGYTEALSDFMDINGDGYPDFVGKNSIQFTTPWGGIGDILGVNLTPFQSMSTSGGIGLSGAKAFSKQLTMNNIKANLTYNNSLCSLSDVSYNTVNITYMDINGDGLPDKVCQGVGTKPNTVCYNIGYGFTEAYPMPAGMQINTTINSPDISITDSKNLSAQFSLEQRSLSGGVSTTWTENAPTFRMIDVDGDGYLDIISMVNDPLVGWLFSIQFNQNNQGWGGYNFIPNISPSSKTFSVGTTASFTVPVFVNGAIKCLINPQLAPYSFSDTQTKMELMDMNGDGFVDLVDGDMIYYNANGTQPTNLLTSVTNPTGQVICLSYTQSEPTVDHAGRSWLLKSVSDQLPYGYGVDDRASMDKEYTYADAYFDTYEKTDYGFDTVRTIELNPGGSVYRTLVQNFANRDFINHGDLLQDSLSDGRRPYIVNKYKTLFGHVVNSKHSDFCDDKNMVRYNEEYHTYYYEGLPDAQIETAYSLNYDQYHNLIRRMDWGDVATQDDDVEQLITYKSASRMPHNLISLPIKEEVRTGSTSLRSSEMDYNSAGSPVAIRFYDNSVASETNLQYDVYGNVISSLSPENNNRERAQLRFAYDPITESYPVFVSNQFGETQLTEYDIRFGVPLKVVDPAGVAIRYRYDPMGRLTDVIAPQEDIVGMPTVHYDYHLPFHNTRPYWSSSVTPDHSFSYVSKVMFTGTQLSGAEVTLYDARGVGLQKKVWQNVGGSDMWVVQSVSEMDKFGRVIGATTPFYTKQPVATYEPNWQGTTASMTKMRYDIMDRKRVLTHPDGHIQHFDFGFSKDYLGTMRFQQIVTNELGDSSILLLSPQEWTIQQINPMGQDTRFRYNALGELLSVTDADGYSTCYKYDMLGRMTARLHPDAGETLWEYDAMGNLVKMQTEALKQAGLDVSYHYLYNRLIGADYPLHPDLDVRYRYYSNGRLAQRYDACGMENFMYDELGNVKQSDRRIYVPSEDKAFCFTHRYSYDSFGKITSIIYPDGDFAHYYYYPSGQLYSVDHTYQGQTTPLIKKYLYDEAARKISVTYGNDVVSDYQYSPDRNWLTATTTRSNNINALLQDLTYGYDPVGNITDISQAAGIVAGLGGPYHNHYNYDALNRLTDSYSRAGTFDYDFDISMSPTGRIGKKNLIAPMSGIKSAQTHGYDAKHTHQPRVIFDPMHGHQSLFWDANGNLSQSIDCKTGATLNFWDEENRLRMTVNPKYAGYYGYDAAGERVYKLTGTTEYDDLNGSNPVFGINFEGLTVYPSPYVVVTEKMYTKHFYAGTEKIATLIGDGGLITQPAKLASEHMERIKDGFYQAFELDEFKFDYTDNVNIKDEQQDELRYHCKYIDKVDVKINSIYPMLESTLARWEKVYGYDDDIFYTHANHLGSASWITDRSGKPIQYIHYAPYGELLANQNGYGYDERYKFTGKERDEESGNDYFGARYYAPPFGIWTSVDPLADKYPNVTPYLYCGGNPVMLVDPDGRDVYRYSRWNAMFVRMKETTDDFDQIGKYRYSFKAHCFVQRTDKNGKALVYNAGVDHNDKLAKGLLKDGLSLEDKRRVVPMNEKVTMKDINISSLILDKVLGCEVAGMFFEVFSGDTKSEYAMFFKTANNSQFESINTLFSLPDNYSITSFFHTHGAATSKDKANKPSKKDLNFKERVLEKYGEDVKTIIFDNYHEGPQQY